MGGRARGCLHATELGMAGGGEGRECVNISKDLTQHRKNQNISRTQFATEGNCCGSARWSAPCPPQEMTNEKVALPAQRGIFGGEKLRGQASMSTRLGTEQRSLLERRRTQPSRRTKPGGDIEVSQVGLGGSLTPPAAKVGLRCVPLQW